MALREYIAVVNITTPIGTTSSNPLLTNISLGDVVINSIDLRIPPGHAGLTGFQARLSNNTLIPWNQPTQWISGNDDDIPFIIQEEVTNGLVIATYNNGTFSHTHLLRINYTPISATQQQSPIVTVVPIT